MEELIALRYPESYTVEYKRFLPNERGQPDAWDQGGSKIGRYARDEILAELIAFANADGGTLILGMDETKEKPPRATGPLWPQREVRELQKRFEDAIRDGIDPPLSVFQVHPIELDDSNGILVFRVGPSRMAPHRVASASQAFMRRGASTVSMTMREIQEHAVYMNYRNRSMERDFEREFQDFLKWRSEVDPITTGFCITALPFDRLPEAPRLFDPKQNPFEMRNFNLEIDGVPTGLAAAHMMTGGTQPILRGVGSEYRGLPVTHKIEKMQSGRIRLWYLRSHGAAVFTAFDPEKFYHGWLLGAAANVLTFIERHRTSVGMPEAEYGIQIVLVAGHRPPTHICPFYVPLEPYRTVGTGWQLTSPTYLLPILSVKGRDEFDSVLATINVDMLDALGARLQVPSIFKVSW